MTGSDKDTVPGKGVLIGLQAKFLVGLAAIFLCFCVLATFLVYMHEKKALATEVFQKTELIMAAVESNRSYVRDILRPRMYEVFGEETFVLEAMSTSYISRVVMDIFQEEHSTFDYRRVAINARNPEFEANEMEREKIKYFSEHPDASDWQGIVKSAGEHVYMRYRPIRLTNSCLRCHGTPGDAPAAVIELYGDELGFNRHPAMVSGVISVGVPVKIGLFPIMGVAWKVFGITFVSVFFLYAIVWFFFNRLVISDLRGLLEIFRENLRDEHGVRLYEQARGKDEVGDLTAAVQTVAIHLQKTRTQLEDYAKNLEKKVAERTTALQHSEKNLRNQVVSRGRELRVLNTISEMMTRSVHLSDILPKVLDQALRVIPATGAGIYLLDRRPGMLALRCSYQADTLPERISFDTMACLPYLDGQIMDFERFVEEVAGYSAEIPENKTALTDNLNIPLCCRGQVLGIMTFPGWSLKEMDPQLQELLFSIGHQVGITIESLQNITRLVDNKELLQSVFDSITDVVMLLDGQYRIKMVNRAFLDRHDLELGQVLNRQFFCLELKRPCPFNSCTTPLSGLPAVPVVEQVHGGDGCIYDVSFYPVNSGLEKNNNVVCLVKDVTEKKEAERRIHQAEKLVSLGKLAAGVAHEINNPLGIILCYTDILEQDNTSLDGQARDDIRVIEKHARSCQRIVNDLLNFARSQKTDKRSGSLNHAIREVIDLVSQQFVKKKIEICLNLDESLPDILFDINKIKQVFLNLFMNSVHAIGESGAITVSTFHDDGDEVVRVVFEDSGTGIPDELEGKIFDPFFSTKSSTEGTGLGLSVSYGIIRDHDGDIRVESEVGSWTRFIITIPC